MTSGKKGRKFPPGLCTKDTSSIRSIYTVFEAGQRATSARPVKRPKGVDRAVNKPTELGPKRAEFSTLRNESQFLVFTVVFKNVQRVLCVNIVAGHDRPLAEIREKVRKRRFS